MRDAAQFRDLLSFALYTKQYFLLLLDFNCYAVFFYELSQPFFIANCCLPFLHYLVFSQ